jgi:hypothetical protein
MARVSYPTHGQASWDSPLKAYLDDAIGNATLTLFNVKSSVYGAKGDNIADDTTAIQNAISACGAAGGGVVYLPQGTYKITSTLALPAKVTLQGAGCGAELNAAVNVSWNPVTSIKWGGASGGTMISLSSPPAQVHIRDLGIDGNNLANYGLYLDRMQAGVVENVGIQLCLVDLIYLFTSNDTLNANAQHNRFTSIHLYGGPSHTGSLIHLAGSSGHLANACHNLFERIVGSYSGTAGIALDDTDNNCFVNTFLYRDAGSGYGVTFGAYARGNYFQHLEVPTTNGVNCATPATSTNTNAIYCYDVQNGQGIPTLAAGANLTYTQEGRTDIAVWHVPYISQREQLFREKQGIKGESFPRICGSASTPLTGQVVYLAGIALMAGDVVTNILVNISGGGTGTSLSKLGIYDVNGTRKGITADQGSVWNAPGGYVVPLLTPYTVAASGTHYLAIVVNASGTKPSLIVGNPTAFAAYPMGSGNLPFATDATTGRTDLPASVTITQASGLGIWLGWS